MLAGVGLAVVVLLALTGSCAATATALVTLPPGHTDRGRRDDAGSGDEREGRDRPDPRVALGRPVPRAVDALWVVAATTATTAVLVVTLVAAERTTVVPASVSGASTVVLAALVVAVAARAGRRAPRRVAGAMVGLLRPVVMVGPLWWWASGLVSLADRVSPDADETTPSSGADDVLAYASAVLDAEDDRGEHRNLLASVIDFGDTVVREVMVPRPDMVTVESEFRVADVMEVAILNGLSRLPATGDGIDDVVGIVFAKDLMRAERDGQEDLAVRSLARPARFVPETKRISALLREMQAEQFHMAVVVDEYGGTAGLVTLEDLIEELVGEIVDEYDREEPMVEPAAEGRVRVNGRLHVDELNDLLDARLPDGDWDTVGGLLFHLVGHVPAEGEWAACDGWLLVAERVQGRRIHRVAVEPSTCPLPTTVRANGRDSS
ncbi:MAG: HlyC/CorC family transporter [Acidimicrobiia bacterium]|nr:HlyC/CorC family transporter [Acidimicrobiia bacterium]